MSPSQVTALDETGQLVFYRALPGQTTPARLPPLPRARVALGPGEFSYRITDESARLDINARAPGPPRSAAGRARGGPASSATSSPTRSRTGATPNELHRLHGAESDFYLALPVPYRARNANLQDAAELLQIRGVTPELYAGHGRPPGARASWSPRRR